LLLRQAGLRPPHLNGHHSSEPKPHRFAGAKASAKKESVCDTTAVARADDSIEGDGVEDFTEVVSGTEVKGIVDAACGDLSSASTRITTNVIGKLEASVIKAAMWIKYRPAADFWEKTRLAIAAIRPINTPNQLT